MTEKLQVLVVNTSTNETPKYATEHAAGMDVRANESGILKPLERKLFKTGLAIAIPVGYECQVRPRSGMAYKQGVTVLNAPGTIDADYRGDVGVILINLSDEEVKINKGDRIAQLVFVKVENTELVAVTELPETERGSGGFGHTGEK